MSECNGSTCFGILDTECLDTRAGTAAMSEASALVIQYNTEQKKWNVCDEFHSLVYPPNATPRMGTVSNNYASFDTQRADYVYKYVTGLSYPTLTKEGKSYFLIRKSILDLFEKWNVKCVFARDTSLEKRFFPYLRLEEACDILQEPMKTQLRYKEYRPANEYAEIYTKCQCGHHDPVLEEKKSETETVSHGNFWSGSSSVSSPHTRTPHCAKADCYTILTWFNKHTNVELLQKM